MQKLWRQYLEWIYYNPSLVLLGVILLTVVAAFQIPKLSVKSDMFDLLPHHFSSVQSIKRLEKEFGGFGYMLLLVEAPSFEQGKQFTETLSLRMERLPQVRFVDYQKPLDFFYTRRFLYLPLKDLKEIDQKVDSLQLGLERKPGIAKKNGAISTLDEELEEIRRNYQFPKPTIEEQYHYNPDKNLFAILIKPNFRSSELARSKQLVSDIKTITATLANQEKFKIEYAGRYVKRVEMDAFMKSQMQLISILVLIGVGFLLTLLFRRPLAIASALLCLITGLIWTFGLTSFWIGSVNIITGFLAAILAGLGIDYSIYFVRRYQQERFSGKPKKEALLAVFTKTSRATLSICLTTILAFSALIPSDFKGYSEFGWIGAWGLLLTFLSIHTILPALFVFWDKWIIKKKFKTAYCPLWFKSLMQLPEKPIISISILFTLVSLLFTWPPYFEFNFSKLEGKSLPSYNLDGKVESVFGNSLIPAVALVRNKKEEKKLLKAVEKSILAKNGSSLLSAKALQSFVPEEQQEKLELIHNLLRKLETLPIEIFEGITHDVAGLIMAQNFGRVSRGDLPNNLKDQFQIKGVDQEWSLVQIFSSVHDDDIQQARKLRDELEDVNKATGIAAASDLMLLADLADILQKDGPRGLIIFLSALFIILWWDTKKCWHALLLMSPLLAGAALTTLLMKTFSVSLNMINVVILPILFGLGIDIIIHQYHRWQENPKEPIASNLWYIFPTVSLAILTSLLGFGMLVLVDHPGIASFGALAIFGISSMYLTGWLITPAILRMWSKKG